jgi:hypothetical protein
MLINSSKVTIFLQVVSQLYVQVVVLVLGTLGFLLLAKVNDWIKVCWFLVPKILCVLVDSICIEALKQILSHKILAVLNQSTLHTLI